ncbi:MAG: secondary thiamine-phosphate synthase enzyme YjbQ [Candidatus Micrarchaeota archaeon]|nr:secondary thiamine-phosphate synthase enzyme YjbQ [Candidatus Micrarchaeota archaeon]
MKITTAEITVNTTGENELIEITEKVQDAITKAEINNGIALVYSQHTTASVLINEYERGFFHDLKNSLSRLAPKNLSYQHNDLQLRNAPPEERKNGHSHILASLIGGSQVIPVVNGKLKLGTWQSIFLIELDAARYRTVEIMVIGE